MLQLNKPVMKIEYVKLQDAIVFPGNRKMYQYVIDGIVKSFDETLLGVPLLAMLNGKLNIIDGQHRWQALEKLGIDGCWCEVWYGWNELEARAAYYGRATRQKRQAAVDVFSLRLDIGEQKATDVFNVVKSVGWTIAFRTGKTRRARYGEISATTALDKIYQWGGKDLLYLTLKQVQDCWPNEVGGSEGRVLKAVAYFHKLYSVHPNYSTKEFVKCMQKHPLSFYLEKSKPNNREATEDGTYAIAASFLTMYNYTKSKRLPPLYEMTTAQTIH